MKRSYRYRSGETDAVIFANLRNGTTFADAAKEAGVSPRFLQNWRRSDPVLEALIWRARSLGTAGKAERIAEAAHGNFAA
jgi:lambda repressor-like predicted transcriptional regulator